ncbi:MAG: glycosyltransferase family 1 protein, partial [Phormidesmis sp. CAN_BIN36]|nr:glycosyltransferase family 1 protein [Phormidesmis sp. CAN_BIN36]
LPVIDHVCQSLEIEQILDIGQPTGIGLRAVGEVPLIEMGKRSSTEISQILQTSIAGFLNYDPTRLAKSGVFAAYCAHGLLPVSANDGDDRDQITAGQHYWVPSVSFNHTALQTIADRAYLWYQTHNISAQANCFATTLMPMQEADQ